MSSLDGLTVCITSYQRPELLDRAIRSVKGAGIRRLTIASALPDARVVEVIERWRKEDWLSYDVAVVNKDIGCNDTWMLAAYRARTKRIIVLHDDDLLCPELGEAYENVIAPAMDEQGVGFATWRASLYFLDGSTAGTEFRHGPYGILPSSELAATVNHRGRLSLSPVISVLDRETVIHAAKESAQTLTAPECFSRPGMLFGTEIIVYMRHIQKFPKWLYMDRVLSHYGSHSGSGTVQYQSSGDLSKITHGYDLARDQAQQPCPAYMSRVIFVHSEDKIEDEEEKERVEIAQQSWQRVFDTTNFIELPVKTSDLKRTGLDVGDDCAVPFIRDLFDMGLQFAMPEDVVVYCNRDVGITTSAYSRLINGVLRGRGVTVCPRKRLNPVPGATYDTLAGCEADGGFDMMAVTESWWKASRELMPDMLIGRESWDTVFRMLAESWADGTNRPIESSSLLAHWQASKAYTDDVCWHKFHVGSWERTRFTNKGQKYNRELGAKFFKARGDHKLVWILTNDQGLSPYVLAEAKKKKEPKVPGRRIVLVLQFWEGDKATAMRNARRIVENEPKFRDDFEFMFVSRFDCSHDEDVVREAGTRFLTTTYTCPRRMRGWPDGCNDLFCESFCESRRRIQSGQWSQVKALFMFEADCIPIDRNWLDRLSSEWQQTEKEGRWLCGWHHEAHTPWGHINGNALYHPNLLHLIPRIAGAPANIPYDQAFASVFSPHWRKSKYLENLYGETNISQQRLKYVVENGAVLLHGCKDGSVETFADSILRKS